MLPTRSQIGDLVTSGRFWWAIGIEDTFITAPHARTGKTLDEYELTGHYDHWRADLGLMTELGVKAARYGIPWHRVQPAADVWDWTFPDQSLGRMLDLGIDPQVDLVHYGLPPWIDGGYLNPGYSRLVADYAARLAERFHGRVHWYTPLNEPRITAWYCGRLGWWPPQQKSWRGFVELMLAIAEGIVATVHALERVDPEIVAYHVDATDLYVAGNADLGTEAERRQHIVFLALDLISGRVDRSHPLWDWLIVNGASQRRLETFLAAPVEIQVVGLNLYPMFTSKRLVRDTRGRLRIRMPYAGADLVSRLARLYHARYRAPIMISETASVGSLRKRSAWLQSSVETVRDVRSEGIPLVGYTWWPMYALIAWAYRQGHRPIADHILQMGLWNLEPDANGDLRRVRTDLVDQFRSLAEQGSASVGVLAPTGKSREFPVNSTSV